MMSRCLRRLIIKRKKGHFISEARFCNNIVKALSIVFCFTLKTNKKCSGRIQLISISSEPFTSCKGANTCNVSLNRNTEDLWV